MIEKINEEISKIEKAKKEISKNVIGQKDMIDKIFIGIFTGGHILLEGVPGLAKSLTVNSVAEVFDLEFSRIQFTPDLLPSDIIGTEIYYEKKGEFIVKKGPVFGNIILADEINRAPAKVQSSLLEAMQEKQVTIADSTFKLEEPFLVLATQNPLEQDGTYPLPEAQQDRFMLKLKIDYPTKSEELEMIERYTSSKVGEKLNHIFTGEDIKRVRGLVREVFINDKLKEYILDIVFKTRENNPYIECGASPRASLNLISASKARAFLKGRDYVTPDDIKHIVYDILRHRIILSYEAEAEEKSVEDVIATILQEVILP